MIYVLRILLNHPHSEATPNSKITGAYCRGLTRAIYILCIEHLRMLRLSGESNPGPPALQANTLCKEPFEWRIGLPFGISACAATAPPKVAMGDRG
jgi:hypothetical protein